MTEIFSILLSEQLVLLFARPVYLGLHLACMMVCVCKHNYVRDKVGGQYAKKKKKKKKTEQKGHRAYEMKLKSN